MRVTGPVTRTASVLLAATIATLAPGITPAALAQPTSGAKPSGAAMPGGSWRPPEPLMKYKPDGNGGKPLKKFEKHTECIQQDRSKDITQQVVRKVPWAQQYLRINEVHELMKAKTGAIGIVEETGERITVAVIDTGVNKHPWLDHLEGLADYVEWNAPGPGLNDCDGHGTLVAGIISADTPDGKVGFEGVAPDARIVSIRQSSANFKEDKDDEGEKAKDKKSQDDSSTTTKPPPEGGESQAPSDGESQPSGASGQGTAAAAQASNKSAGNIMSLAHAIVYAAKQDEVDVMNISINECEPVSDSMTNALRALQAAIHWAVAVQDIVIVTSAGNVSQECKQNNRRKPRTIVVPPWFANDVLAVAAITREGGVADFSMHGPWVDVAAPGTHILSLDPAPKSEGLANLMSHNGQLSRIKGTSFAAPYVAGLAALVRAKYPELNAYEVMERIKATAQHPAALGGRNQYVGYGVINPMAALTATVAEIESDKALNGPIPADLPPPADRDWTPVAVALGGAGGAIVALLITLFTVHTIRRNRQQNA